MMEGEGFGCNLMVFVSKKLLILSMQIIDLFKVLS